MDERSTIRSLTPDHPYLKGRTLSDLFRSNGYPYLVMRILKGDYVTKADLRIAKEANPGIELPEVISDYERRKARGEIKRPGRSKSDLLHHIKIILAKNRYPRLLRRLQWRAKNYERRSISSKNETSCDAPPHEAAARILAKRFFKNRDWRHVLNLIHEE